MRSVAYVVPKISTFIQAYGHDKIELAIDPDQKYIYFIWSEKLPFAYYILFT